MQILLVDRSPAMVSSWQAAFADREDVEVIEDDYFARPAGAMVSPANSFGIMDGGLDAAIRDTLGFVVQQRTQRVIVERHHGELRSGRPSSSRPGTRDGQCSWLRRPCACLRAWRRR